MPNTTHNDLAEAPKRRRGAPKGNRNALKTGLHTAEMKDLRRRLRAWRRRARAAIARGNEKVKAHKEARRQSRLACAGGERGRGGARKMAQNAKTIRSCGSAGGRAGRPHPHPPDAKNTQN